MNMNNLNFIKRLEYTFVSNFYKRDKNLWIFGEWFGKRCGDNAAYFANYLAENYPEYKLVWITEKETDTSVLNSNIDVIERDTEQAYQYMKKAKYVVMNENYGDFSKYCYNLFGNAMTVNLWHGVPWKKIGYDAETKSGLALDITKIVRDFIHQADLYLSPSASFDLVLKSAFNIDDKQILRAGYPRNSSFYNNLEVEKSRKKVIEKINSISRIDKLDDCKIIAYMPTFRDNTKDIASLQQLTTDKHFNDFLKMENIVIIQKMHVVCEQYMNEKVENEVSRIIIDNDFNACELLSAADVLITDYSSCFFDYLILDRPIIHYIYDYDYYKNKDRGLYYEKEDVLCGNEVYTAEELKKEIKLCMLNSSRGAELRKIRKQQYLTYETEDSCAKIHEYLQKL